MDHEMHGKMSPTVGMFTDKVECMLGINNGGYMTHIMSDDSGTYVMLYKWAYDGKHTISIQESDGTVTSDVPVITLRPGDKMEFIDEKDGIQTYNIQRTLRFSPLGEAPKTTTVSITPVWSAVPMTHDMMDMSMSDMTKMLEGKTGDELNKAFLEAMIPHHQWAVEMAWYLAGSDKPELVKLGADIIVAQTKEIEQMQNWMKEWGYTK